MNKNSFLPMFIEYFEREDEAKKFAYIKKGEVIVKYNYDFFEEKIVKTYEVRY